MADNLNLDFSGDLDQTLEDYIDEDIPRSKRSKDYEGEICRQCNEYYPFANGPNQMDGETFVCYGCRMAW